MTNRQAALRLGVSLETLTAINWKWRPMLRGQGTCVRIPGTGGRCNLNPVEVIEQIIAARDAAERQKQSALEHLPEGLVDRDGA